MFVLQLAVWRVYLFFKEVRDRGCVCGGYFRVVALRMWCSSGRLVVPVLQEELSPGGVLKHHVLQKELNPGGWQH